MQLGFRNPEIQNHFKNRLIRLLQLTFKLKTGNTDTEQHVLKHAANNKAQHQHVKHKMNQTILEQNADKIKESFEITELQSVEKSKSDPTQRFQCCYLMKRSVL